MYRYLLPLHLLLLIVLHIQGYNYMLLGPIHSSLPLFASEEIQNARVCLHSLIQPQIDPFDAKNVINTRCTQSKAFLLFMLLIT